MLTMLLEIVISRANGDLQPLGSRRFTCQPIQPLSAAHNGAHLCCARGRRTATNVIRWTTQVCILPRPLIPVARVPTRLLTMRSLHMRRRVQRGGHLGAHQRAAEVDGLAHARAARALRACELLLGPEGGGADAGAFACHAVRIRWPEDLDREVPEPESFTWSILQAANFNKDAHLGWRLTKSELARRAAAHAAADK